jgi:hypothetical protein
MDWKKTFCKESVFSIIIKIFKLTKTETCFNLHTLWYKDKGGSDCLRMRIRKPICILLVPFLAISFFASGAAAKPSCNENTCQKMDVPTGHHQAKTMALASDCCARHQQLPCELERRQSDELSVFTVSAFRLDNFQSVRIINSSDHSLLNPYTAREPDQSSLTGATARSSPIYLKNLSLLC